MDCREDTDPKAQTFYARNMEQYLLFQDRYREKLSPAHSFFFWNAKARKIL